MSASEGNDKLADGVINRRLEVPYCDEYEKMISGKIFSTSNSIEMQNHRLAVLRLLKQFNNDDVPERSTLQSLCDCRMGIAEQFLKELGQNVNINIPFFISWGCNTSIGEGTYLNRNVSIYDDAKVVIGKNVRIAMDVCICTGTHQAEPYLRAETGGSLAYPITIEDECWIGARATILPGVRIGHGSLITAGAVVTKDVEPMCIYGGVPAKLIRRIEQKSEDVADMEGVRRQGES